MLSSCVSKKKFESLLEEQAYLQEQLQKISQDQNVLQEDQQYLTVENKSLKTQLEKVLDENERLQAKIRALENMTSVDPSSPTEVESKILRSSGKYPINNADLRKGFPEEKNFKEVGKKISLRLSDQGYKDHIFFLRLPQGFAVVTDLEQINDPKMGTPLPGAQRWNRVLPSFRYFDVDLIDRILESLVGREGYFRFMIIVVSNDTVSERSEMTNIDDFNNLELFSEPEFETWNLPNVSSRTFAKVFVYQFHAKGNSAAEPIARMDTDAVENNLLNSGLTNVFRIFFKP